MKEEILDRRVRKTRRQLKECLTRLLKEKKIQDITVRELAGMAALLGFLIFGELSLGGRSLGLLAAVGLGGLAAPFIFIIKMSLT